MRYVYLKANNAVSEYNNIRNSNLKHSSGAESFLNDFLRFTDGEPTLVLSLHTHPKYNEYIKHNNVYIKSYYRHSNYNFYLIRFIGQIIHHLLISWRIFFNIIKFRPDYILCWSRSFPHWACFLSAKITKSHFTFSRHISFIKSQNSFISNFISKIDISLLKKADNVLVHGPYLKELSMTEGVQNNKTIMFDCIYDVNSTWQIRDQNVRHMCLQKHTDNDINILFIGRMIKEKGIFDLMVAYKNICIDFNNVKLQFAGIGSDFQKLQHMIEYFELQSHVYLLGLVSQFDLPEIISKSYCVVAPTQSIFPEGRCMAAMEGLVLGKPVIAPNFGPFPYLVHHGINGLLYKADCVTDLQSCLYTIVHDGELYIRLQQGAHESRKDILANKQGYFEALAETLLPLDVKMTPVIGMGANKPSSLS